MVPRGNNAASMGVPPMPRREEFVTDTSFKKYHHTNQPGASIKCYLFCLIKQLIMKTRKILIRGFGDQVECQESLVYQIRICKQFGGQVE